MAYEIKDGQEWSDGRDGPRLDFFSEILLGLKVNQFFEIPLVKNVKGKFVPERGFNLKAANDMYAPFVFKKKRVDPVGEPGAEGYKPGYIKVQRVK